MAAAGPIAEVRRGVETGVADDETEAGPSVESRWSKACVSIQSEVGVHGGNAVVVVMIMSVSVLRTPGTGESEWYMLGACSPSANPGECSAGTLESENVEVSV